MKECIDLLKHGLDESVLKNYRPVPNLPFMSQILKKILFNCLAELLAQNNVIDIIQSAFVKKKRRNSQIQFIIFIAKEHPHKSIICTNYIYN